MPRKRRQMLKRLGALGATPLAAGCLGDGGTNTTGGPYADVSPTSTDTATSNAPGTTVDAQSKFPDYNWDALEGVDTVAATTITMSGYAFEPLVAAIRPGTTVTVRNEDAASHTMTIPALGVTETLSGGGSTTLTIAETGTYDYVCEFHPPDMLGRLVVGEDVATPAGTDTPTDTPTATPTDTTAGTPTPTSTGDVPGGDDY